MIIVDVHASTPYQVCIGPSLLPTIGEQIKGIPHNSYQKIALFSDSNVMPLYGETVERSLKASGYEVFLYTIPAGESSKSFENLQKILSWLADNFFTRTDLLLALGGGVIGDLIGFSASIYLRGCDFVQLPTTLLAAVDSSVGGKTAVNLPQGKNLIGTFWQPRLVICDTETFKTLTLEVFSDGVAEVLKYGCIWDEDLFSLLENASWTKDNVSTVVARCVRIKAEIVRQDERDTGLRQILNFGHTLGHGVEKLSNLTVSHGKAVAVGMCLVTKAEEKRGNVPIGTTKRLQDALRVYGLPTETTFSLEDISRIALGDKKRKGDYITLISLEKIGKYQIKTIPVGSLAAFVKGETYES